MTELSEQLAARTDLPPELRRHATDLARRIGDHAALLNNGAALALAKPISADRLAGLLRDTLIAVGLTDDPYAWAIRARVLLKVGQPAEALEALDRAERGFAATRPNWSSLSPAVAPFRVLALAGVGRLPEARALLSQFEASLPTEPGEEVRRFVEECRRAVGSDPSR
jgi:hypothetical protein